MYILDGVLPFLEAFFERHYRATVKLLEEDAKGLLRALLNFTAAAVPAITRSYLQSPGIIRAG